MHLVFIGVLSFSLDCNFCLCPIIDYGFSFANSLSTVQAVRCSVEILLAIKKKINRYLLSSTNLIDQSFLNKRVGKERGSEDFG